MSKLLKPVKNTKTFFKDARIFQGVLTRNSDGTLTDLGEKSELGAFSKEKFAGSRQILRGPVWSVSLKQFNIGDISDEDLNKLVKECDLYDKLGRPITTANRRRFDDPFFNHSELRINMEEGESDIEETAIGKVLELGLNVRTQIDTSNSSNPLTSARTKFKLIDQETESTEQSLAVDTWAELGALLMAMDEPKMKKIAIAMKAGTDENSSISVIKSTLGKILMGEEKIVKGTNESYKAMFLRLAKAPEEEVNIQYYVATAIRKGYLRRKANQGWLYNGKPIATTESQLASYFLDPNNQEDYFELERLIVGDTSKNTSSRTKSKAK